MGAKKYLLSQIPMMTNMTLSWAEITFLAPGSNGERRSCWMLAERQDIRSHVSKNHEAAIRQVQWLRLERRVENTSFLVFLYQNGIYNPPVQSSPTPRIKHHHRRAGRMHAPWPRRPCAARAHRGCRSRQNGALGKIGKHAVAPGGAEI